MIEYDALGKAVYISDDAVTAFEAKGISRTVIHAGGSRITVLGNVKTIYEAWLLRTTRKNEISVSRVLGPGA